MTKRYTVQEFVLTHGSWQSLLQRCVYRGRRKDYGSYKGRGVKVDPAWLTFENFLQDMGARPSPAHSLDRKNNDQGYSKKNCRWATAAEQAANRRSTVLLTFRGKTQPRSVWAREVGLSQWTIGLRLRHGWSVQKALTTPPQKYNPVHRTFAQGRSRGKKLDAGQVKEIIRRAQTGETARGLAAEFKVSAAAICHIAKQFGVQFKKGRPRKGAT